MKTKQLQFLSWTNNSSSNFFNKGFDEEMGDQSPERVAAMADQSPEWVADTASATATDNKERMKGRKMSWAKLRRVDSLNMEAGSVSFTPSHANNSQVRTS